jgi:CYTH domain-containing protein
MAIEIERKFLVRDTHMLAGVPGVHMRQGYLAINGARSGHDVGMTVRVRIAGPQAWLTLKGDTHGISRSEFEYAGPVADAEAMLACCPWPVLEKTRHRLPVGAHVFEVDVFHGGLAPLVLAEVELRAEDEAFPRPAWLGDDVSDDPQYRNSELAARLGRAAGKP